MHDVTVMYLQKDPTATLYVLSSRTIQVWDQTFDTNSELLHHIYLTTNTAAQMGLGDMIQVIITADVCHIMKNVHSVTYGKNLLLWDQMYNACITKGPVAVFNSWKV